MSAAGAALRRRTLLLLGAAAGLSAVAGAGALLPPAGDLPRSEVGALVFPGFASKAGLVTRISITTGEESYSLVKTQEGWILPEKGGYRVLPARIEELMQALSEMTYARPMTRDERKFDHIGLGDPAEGGTGALLEAGDDAGASFAKILVGHRDGRSYIRRSNDLQAWVVDHGVLPPLQRAMRWLDLAIAPLALSEISSVEVTPARGPAYRLDADAAGVFRPAAPYNRRPLAAPLAGKITGEALVRLAPVDVAPAGRVNAGRPLAAYRVRTREGAVISVQSWRQDARGWITLSAAAGEDATPDVLARVADINTRASPWAFALTEGDWRAFSTPLSEIID